MTLIDRLHEAVNKNHGIALTATEVVELVNEIESRVAAGPAPQINLFTVPCPQCGYVRNDDDSTDA